MRRRGGKLGNLASLGSIIDWPCGLRSVQQLSLILPMGDKVVIVLVSQGFVMLRWGDSHRVSYHCISIEQKM